MSLQKWKEWLVNRSASSAFVGLLKHVLDISKSVDLADGDWNVVGWLKRPRSRATMRLRISIIGNDDLRRVAILWILHGRFTSKIGAESAQLRLYAVRALDRVWMAKRRRWPVRNDDFQLAERDLEKTCGHGTAFRHGMALQQLASWMAITFALPLSYTCKLPNPAVHGRYGTEPGRREKLVSLVVLKDLIAARRREDLSVKDRFFIAALTLNIAVGLRVSEMATMPTDCIRKEGGRLQLLYFPAKSLYGVPRVVHPMMADIVEECVAFLLHATKRARAQMETIGSSTKRLDWSRITKCDDAFRYFTQQWAHRWTSNAEHNLFNKNGAWHSGRRCYVNAIRLLGEARGNKSAVARHLGVSRATFDGLLAAHQAARAGKLPRVRNSNARGSIRRSWDTDTRVISFMQLEKHTGLVLNQAKRHIVSDILDQARRAQLSGRVYAAPTPNLEMDEQFAAEVPCLLRDGSGKTILSADKALFVIEKYSFAERRRIRHTESTWLADHHFIRWLSGETRARGTGNFEDSVFRRLGIIDPDTGEIASFTWHSIRHWLDTAYENGGLTQDQIALIFGRNNPLQNKTYDQTSSRVRLERLRSELRNGLLIGTTATRYENLAKFSRDEAEAYLAAKTRMINPMPHGICMLDWSRAACPHHLSCLRSERKESGPCEHLTIDPKDDTQVSELVRIEKDAGLTISAMKSNGGSPQLEHFKELRSNVRDLLEEVRVKRTLTRSSNHGA